MRDHAVVRQRFDASARIGACWRDHQSRRAARLHGRHIRVRSNGHIARGIAVCPAVDSPRRGTGFGVVPEGGQLHGGERLAWWKDRGGHRLCFWDDRDLEDIDYLDNTYADFIRFSDLEEIAIRREGRWVQESNLLVASDGVL